MLQQSKMNTLKPPWTLYSYPNCLVPSTINPKNPEVCKFQLPSINQSGISIPCFPPLVLGQKVGSVGLYKHRFFKSHDEIPWDERSGMFIYTYIYVLVFFLWESKGWNFICNLSLFHAIFPMDPNLKKPKVLVHDGTVFVTINMSFLALFWTTLAHLTHLAVWTIGWLDLDLRFA